ncbi:putative elastin-like [Capsicum annuum]|nr:putative elastin-like [Capsicum annuum]
MDAIIDNIMVGVRRKLLFVWPNTAVFPPVFKIGNGKDTFLGSGGDFRKFLDGLVDADDVPTYVKEHPLIGQPAITTSHPDWNYYAKIIVRFVVTIEVAVATIGVAAATSAVASATSILTDGGRGERRKIGDSYVDGGNNGEFERSGNDSDSGGREGGDGVRDHEDEIVTRNLKLLDLPLEKLNVGPKQKLLVLNLGGLLVDRVHQRNESAVLSRNIEPVLDNILVGLRRKLVFVWDQDNCIDSGFSTVEKKNKPIFLKQLKKIWENNSYGGRFSKSNTLLIDDEPHVALLNPPNTGVFPHAYKVNDGRDTFLGPKGEMQEFLEGLIDAIDVPSYVKGHPFGQPAITDSHRDWDYYDGVVRAVEDPGFGYTDYESDY